MPFDFRNLDNDTRRYMVEEIDAAIHADNLYFSKRFTAAGEAAWPTLLLDAARGHDEHWLAYQLEAQSLLKDLEGSGTPSGGYTTKYVPHTAAETIAEGQFNRYYILGVCCRAMEEGIGQVIVYRAKAVADPRPESEALLGELVNPSVLSDEIRPRDQSLRHALLQPNSGLTVHI